MSVNLRDVTVRFNDNTVLDNLSYDFPSGKITCILGRSGVGKSTLLNVVAGLRAVAGVEKYKCAYMFQTPCLIEQISVADNVELVLFNDCKDKTLRKQLVSDMLSAAGLDGMEKRLPSTLSGGEKQRVSMARAFVFPSEVLLMDEPFQALDIALTAKMLKLLIHLHEGNPRTVLYVTHSVEEALQVADNIVVLKEGKLQQISQLPPSKKPRCLSEIPAEVRNELYDSLMN